MIHGEIHRKMCLEKSHENDPFIRRQNAKMVI